MDIRYISLTEDDIETGSFMAGAQSLVEQGATHIQLSTDNGGMLLEREMIAAMEDLCVREWITSKGLRVIRGEAV